MQLCWSEWQRRRVGIVLPVTLGMVPIGIVLSLFEGLISFDLSFELQSSSIMCSNSCCRGERFIADVPARLKRKLRISLNRKEKGNNILFK